MDSVIGLQSIFVTGSGEKVTLEEIIKRINNFLSKAEGHNYTIDIGTDSQNFHKTKMVTVICVHIQGKGGIFFYHTQWFRKIKSLREKIYKETELSLDCARILTDLFLDNDMLYEISVHADIGEQGRTRELIREILGYINASGFNGYIKPEAWVASAVANRITK